MSRLALPGSFFLMVAALLAVGLVSWFRTGALRRGAIPQARDPPGDASFSSSRATLLAALAGLAAVAWGGEAAGGHRLAAIVLVPVGLFVAVAGWVARVTGFRAGDDGLVVTFARRPPFRAPWAELRALKPPAGPLGGWRLSDSRGARTTLMPSDLFGHEEVLALIVLRAGLRFDGRTWIHDLVPPAR